MEAKKITYSHDYPNDTALIYVRDGNHAHLLATYTSEDPDYGTETIEYNGINGESMEQMMSDLLEEITDYLDRHGEFTYPSGKHGIHSLDGYYGEYGRSTLYAIEAALINELK